jgi:heptosyltransferase-1
MQKRNFKKILIVKPSSLGDIIHSLPLLNEIKSNFPGSVVHWVIAKGLEGILEDHPLVDRLWVINKDNWGKPSLIIQTFYELFCLYRNLKAENYDLVLDLQGLLRSGIITLFTHAPLRAGFSDARELSPLFYNLKVHGGKNIHAVERYLKIGTLIGMDITDATFPLPSVDMNHDIKEPYYVVVPGARWPSKRWPAENFVEVMKAIPLRAIIVGGREDIDLSLKVYSGTTGNSINMTGRTDLHMLVSLIKGAVFILSNDTGPMHIGAALSVPVYAIFGPTDEKLTGPYGNIHRIFRADISCSPCFNKRCKTMACMKEIRPKMVIEAIRKDILETGD